MMTYNEPSPVIAYQDSDWMPEYHGVEANMGGRNTAGYYVSVGDVSWPPDNEAWKVLSVVGMTAGAYHGYKRNDSIGWAIGWALLGGAFPFITLPVSLAQGFGKRAR